jgi:ubiquinol-cytochrome c reductase cytochrome b subunit/menaquinol-cytochrome c reductase cytochrome b subunit
MAKLPAPPLPAPLKAPPPRPGEGNGPVRPADHAAGAGVSLVDWVDERTSLSGAARWAMFRKVPKGTNWFYTLGSATMFAFLSQAVTGCSGVYLPDPSRGAPGNDPPSFHQKFSAAK